MKKIALTLLGCTLITCFGCVKKQPEPTTTLSTNVAQTLGKASEESHVNLAMLARLRGMGAIPQIAAPDPALRQEISISWTGPANSALKDICLKVGYKYAETGRKRAQLMPIVVQAFNRPAYDIIEDIAWQVQPNAVVKVDTVRRTVTLAGAGSK